MRKHTPMPANHVTSAVGEFDRESNPECSASPVFDEHDGDARAKDLSAHLVREIVEPFRDRARACAANSRTPTLIRETPARKDALVEFFAHSKKTLRILGLLAARRRPLGYRALADEFHTHEECRCHADNLPDGAVRAFLSIMQAAGLLRMTRRGFSITEVGRELYQRMDREVCRLISAVRDGHSIRTNGHRAIPTLSIPIRPVLWELRGGARTVAFKHKRALL